MQIRAGEKRYRSGAKREIEPDEVIMVEHTHEPIVGEDIFYRISSKIEEKRKLKRNCTSNAKSYGILVRTFSYGCPHIQRIDSLKCDSHFISQNAINKIVLETMRKEFNLSGIHVKTLVDFNRTQERESEKYFVKKERD